MVNKMKKVFLGIFITIASLIVLILIVHGLMFKFNLTYRSWWNEFYFQRDVIDQEIDYENRRMVEDTARAMISNYNAYKQTWNTYKDFANDSNEYQYAISAKIAANNIVSNYNNYITQNSFVWAGNLPDDIPPQLTFIE